MSEHIEYDSKLATARRIGQSDLVAPPLALGTAVFGWTLPPAQSFGLLDRFLEFGGGLIDTAASYASGMSEHTIGSWMRERGTRNNVLIATKVGRHADAPGLSARSIREGVDASLVRLQTDRIDLLYLHAEDPDTPLGDSLLAVDELIQAGKVRALGASNFSLPALLEARILSSSGLPRIEAVAWEYSLLRRDIVTADATALLADLEMSLMPFFVLAHGYLGQFRDVKANPSTDDVRLRRAAAHVGRHSHAVLKVLDGIALSHGVDISAIALTWAISRHDVACASIGPESIAQLDGLMAARQINLSRHDVAELERVSL